MYLDHCTMAQATKALLWLCLIMADVHWLVSSHSKRFVAYLLFNLNSWDITIGFSFSYHCVIICCCPIAPKCPLGEINRCKRDAKSTTSKLSFQQYLRSMINRWDLSLDVIRAFGEVNLSNIKRNIWELWTLTEISSKSLPYFIYFS